MTLLTIAEGLALNVGMTPTTVVVGNAERQSVETLQFANEAGEELARRVDWGQLRETVTLTGNGTDLVHTLPAGFSRITPGVAVRAGTATVRPLSRSEWNTLTPVQGTPRYFLLENKELTLWPYLPSAATVTVTYQTLYWTSAGGAAFAADAETSLIDEALFIKALSVRWRRQKGMPYQDEEAEFEATLADFAQFSSRDRF